MPDVENYGEEENGQVYKKVLVSKSLPFDPWYIKLYFILFVKIRIGEGVFINAHSWKNYIIKQAKESLFVKSLAVAIWSSNVLRNRSVTGSVCPTKRDRDPPPPLSPKKLGVVRGRQLFVYYDTIT